MSFPEPSSVAESTSATRLGRGGGKQQACEVNLNLIFDAIQQYRSIHRDFPVKLSDLVPEFIDDPKTLICPEEQKTWSLRGWKHGFRDPAFDPHASYTYEFNKADIPDGFWRGLPKQTWRKFKQAQMAQLEQMGWPGGRVPIVRCLSHQNALNLGYDGRVYESGHEWENKFAQGGALESLEDPGKLFADRTSPKIVSALDFPPRDSHASPRLLDLTANYNAQLSDGWQGFPGNDLAQMPSGLQQFNGVPFDVRGVIQLGGAEAAVVFTNKIEGIAVHQRFKRLNVLHAATFPPVKQRNLARYVLHYFDGQTNEIPIVYGENIADWWFDPKGQLPRNAQVAWEGSNEAVKAYEKSLHLYHMNWDNPLPDVEVVSISLVSCMNVSAPFVIAITIDP
jgi:hypothetical protein